MGELLVPVLGSLVGGIFSGGKGGGGGGGGVQYSQPPTPQMMPQYEQILNAMAPGITDMLNQGGFNKNYSLFPGVYEATHPQQQANYAPTIGSPPNPYYAPLGSSINPMTKTPSSGFVGGNIGGWKPTNPADFFRQTTPSNVQQLPTRRLMG